jgi:uncharacterized protein (TIGR02679 family)
VSGTDAQRLRRLLGRPELQPVLDRLQRQLERGELGRTLTFTGLEPATRNALEGLLGRRPGRGASLRVRVAELDAVVRSAGAAPDLTTAVAVLRGPLRDRRGEREMREAAWSDLFQEHERDLGTPTQRAWLKVLFGDGLLKRLSGGDPARGRQLLRDARRVIDRLPAHGISLSQLAAETLGDAHGLDSGRPIASLVRRYAAALVGNGVAATANAAERERDLWGNVGVLMGGGVTSRVLALNLPALDRGPTGRMLAALGRAGQPALLTLRQLVTDPPAWRLPQPAVFVCENPAVVAAGADRLGPRSLPLVCTDGQPSAAVANLLRCLSLAGALLHYHGDYDWPGISIANGIMERFGARPWRFDSRCYREAPASGKPLSGRPVSACWEPGLTTAMEHRGMVVEEELVLDGLIADLEAQRGDRGCN